MLHLHCIDDWLDLFGHDLFNDSLLDLVCSTCCLCLRILHDLLHHFVALTCGRYLFNDSFQDTLLWNAVNNFNGLLCDLSDGYVQDQLRTVCRQRRSRISSSTVSSVNLSMRSPTEWTTSAETCELGTSPRSLLSACLCLGNAHIVQICGKVRHGEHLGIRGISVTGQLAN